LVTFFGIKESIGFHVSSLASKKVTKESIGRNCVLWHSKNPLSHFLQSACDAASNNPLVAAVTPGVQTCQSARLRH